MNSKPQSAFIRKILIRQERTSENVETWHYPEDISKKVEEEIEINPSKNELNLIDIATQIKKFPFQGKTKKYFVGYCIIVMKTLYRCCKLKEKINNTIVFKQSISQILGIDYNQAIKTFIEISKLIYSEQNLGKCNRKKGKSRKSDYKSLIEKQIRIPNPTSKKPVKNINTEKSLPVMIDHLDRAIQCERFSYGPRRERAMSLQSMIDEIQC
ncbi:hypothetical protein EHI8A_157390 [Entamoeba histolytica HM-1:IMSS-B]|uniref:Uncharacterized protein n=6 Tax=Entamoeba histolytica TaxID=5759 RepID=C4M4I9_ENTH1|nr:hypothetical protein EHI_138980 [Entamoeba histolytica HM-1:IMSS]EMD43113.1 Hypothetical protein EHI5A_036190 [Entamoeba histolytica KU27]EMH78194.1 hypothetical protein EHI8A_157390 [Entamoeba histolytica HM-1:IMSS-B]EMS14861.1 hypothetical protein KM1_045980 [Entamoeba histolytica HM-3:IMSS]ENY64751.1 hypothetical protein EHI7A_019930 [Entamoeba histolytica HM-1:IMSS-A]GAT96293.1 hypothetical protein CL6EHI_138980 [Entamoeba histolytica]|eukprot:XP_651646.1 hypothetical protein EHI_138980 [Entamoeba histolytica HM-1:IMSS]